MLNKEQEKLLGTLIRDITKVGSMSKSEARRRIEEILKAQRQELFSEINKWGRTMMDKKVPLKEMGEDPEYDGWYDYDELTSSIISHIRYDEKGNLKKEYE